MAGILSTATTFAHWVIEAMHSLHNLTQTVVNFNCQLVAAMFRLIVEGCRAFVIISSLLVEAAWTVLLNFLEVLVEIGRLILICFGFLGEFFVWSYNLCAVVVSVLQIVLEWFSSGLLFGLQFIHKQVVYVINTIDLSSITPVRQTIEKFIVENVSASIQYMGDCYSALVSLLVQAALFLANLSTEFLSAIVSGIAQCVEGVSTFALAIFSICSSATSSLCDFLASNISWNVSYELHLTCLLTSVGIGMCMVFARVLHQRGFTCPLFVSSSNYLIQLEYNGDDEFIESDVEENPLEDEVEEEAEEDQGSEVNEVCFQITV
jgi:hypothetical protein